MRFSLFPVGLKSKSRFRKFVNILEMGMHEAGQDLGEIGKSEKGPDVSLKISELGSY